MELLLEQELDKFKSFVCEHRSANHKLFDVIEGAAKEGKLKADQYHLFAVNIATRTMLSLPEIHACCIQASLDLDPLRTAYSVMTGAEEGGAGKPKEVHSVLMMNALNYHAAVIYHLPPLNLKYFMSLVRLHHATHKYANYLKIKQQCLSLSDEQLSCFVNKEELIDICRRCADTAGIKVSIDSWQCISEIARLEQEAHSKLLAASVLQETIDYCLAQLDLLTDMRTGYLQGVGFAHEALADDMIYRMFRIMYAQIDHYPSTDDFMEKVYPYYAAHGNYIDVYCGLAEDTEGVEVTHAQRELEKIECLDKEALDVAWQGANDFADRNAKIWDGLLREFQ